MSTKSVGAVVQAAAQAVLDKAAKSLSPEQEAARFLDRWGSAHRFIKLEIIRTRVSQWRREGHDVAAGRAVDIFAGELLKLSPAAQSLVRRRFRNNATVTVEAAIRRLQNDSFEPSGSSASQSMRAIAVPHIAAALRAAFKSG